MSEDAPIGLAVAEKLVGLILIIVGAVVAYSSSNPPAGDISHFSGMFTAAGLVIVAVGIFLVIAKAE
jgi:VIT1/CCC1 family predicted Fe2+/Mn2+ transporter